MKPDTMRTFPEQLRDGLKFIHIDDHFDMEPAQWRTHETDFQRWLGQNGQFIAGDEVSHRDFIKTVADKLGGHSDLDEGEWISAFRAIKGHEHSRLADYLERVASGTLQLSRRVLASRSAVDAYATQ